MGRVLYGLGSMVCPLLAVVLVFGGLAYALPASAEDVRASPDEEVSNVSDTEPVEPETVSEVEPETEPETEPVEPVTPQLINDAAFLIAGCFLFGVMFLAGLIFSRYVPGGFVHG